MAVEERFKEMLRQKGLKVTEQRMLVLSALCKRKGEHLTVEDIYDEVQKISPEIGLATIYRNVQLLFEMNLIDRVNLDDRCARYEIAIYEQGEKEHHHHHLICTSCGQVFSFQGDWLEELECHMKDQLGFEVTDHELKFYGLCANCRRKTKEHEIN